ncbi:endonuclease/exonuclease/phosphatase family protein [Thermodesulfobacteriota bacterium]
MGPKTYRLIAVLILTYLAISAAHWTTTRSWAEDDPSPDRIRIGTFNIRMFPCNNRCECIKNYGFSRCRRPETVPTVLRNLACEIKKIHPDLIAVNEILSPNKLRKFAQDKLGAQWKFVYTSAGGPQKVGFLYDSSVLELQGRKVFKELYTELRPEELSEACAGGLDNLRPAFACRFRVKGCLFDFVAIVLHLKSGRCAEIRRAQWSIMEQIVDQASELDDDIIIIGDFNDWQRRNRDFDPFCKLKGFTLLTDAIPCTFLYKSRGSAIDHILLSDGSMEHYVEGSAGAGGPCADKCGPSRYWETFRDSVSDHCPVFAELRTGS